MTLYQEMTLHIDSYTRDASAIETTGGNAEGIRGMIRGMKNARDMLTIETASMETAI